MISWGLDKLYRVNSRTVWGDVFQYLENMDGQADIAVAYMGPEVTAGLVRYANKFNVLISVDFEIPEIKTVRVVDVCNGIPPRGG